MMEVMRSSRLATLLRRETTVTWSWEASLSRAASSGFISSQAFGTMLLRTSTLAVSVRVCQCSTVRTVLRMKSYSPLGCSENGSQGTVKTWLVHLRWGRCHRSRGVRLPLLAASSFDSLPGELAVVAHAAGGDALPFGVGVAGCGPAGIERLLDVEVGGESRKMSKSARASPG